MPLLVSRRGTLLKMLRFVLCSLSKCRIVKQAQHLPQCRHAATDPATGRKKCFWGRLNFCGEEHRPYYFQVVFEDDNTRIKSAATVRKWLEAEAAPPPGGMVISVLVLLNHWQTKFCAIRSGSSKLVTGLLRSQHPWFMVLYFCFLHLAFHSASLRVLWPVYAQAFGSWGGSHSASGVHMLRSCT